MSKNASQRIQDEISNVADTIDVQYLRKLQSRMYKCSAECCDNRELTNNKELNRCVSNCFSQFERAREFVMNEFNNLQDRMNRCHMGCSDKIRDKMSATPTEAEVEKYRGELEKCANKCAETHIEVVSQIMKRTKEYFGQEEYKFLFT